MSGKIFMPMTKLYEVNLSQNECIDQEFDINEISLLEIYVSQVCEHLSHHFHTKKVQPISDYKTNLIYETNDETVDDTRQDDIEALLKPKVVEVEPKKMVTPVSAESGITRFQPDGPSKIFNIFRRVPYANPW